MCRSGYVTGLVTLNIVKLNGGGLFTSQSVLGLTAYLCKASALSSSVVFCWLLEDNNGSDYFSKTVHSGKVLVKKFK
jgi:hypothetical protein